MPPSDQRRGALFGLTAAALFGLSAPLAKQLVPEVGPLMLAALLYLGAGLALSVAGLVTRRRRAPDEARVRKSDLPWLMGIIVLGGVGGPVLMLVGLELMSAVAGSLLLNLEAPFTILMAVVVFREHLGWRAGVSALLIVSGAVALASGSGEWRADAAGVLALASACLCWAVDNNLTQKLSVRSPLIVVRHKALGAGGCSLVVALAVGERFPEPKWMGLALLLGAFSYGISVVLDMHALRLLGAAREAIYFATAPFIGAVGAVVLLGEPLVGADILAGVLMLLGAALLVVERHRHLHAHEAMEHDHLHVHDAHHQHPHTGGEPAGEPHSHPHRHAPLVHDHPHVSDVHHRHRH